jgi:hypothetical protein
VEDFDSFDHGCINPHYAHRIFARHYYDVEIIVETPIPKVKRIGIGKLNNPAQRRV